eukprot:Gregarina_sp_Poly_1__7138@NODE_390_length_8980_cov_56_327724_g319_i0_p6_GENE_NODE_390_length_8980_cov_56_327724_g319_i0NODE_390_length_8980_cov_56_327724_g319_i0_p6_ORF_typecomplete_len102_score14_51_NODE_390_length_8980_cov_56_327724_g319_i020962401
MSSSMELNGNGLLLKIKAHVPVDANDDPLPSAFSIAIVESSSSEEVAKPIHDQYVRLTLASNTRMTPSDYEVGVGRLVFNLTNTGVKYSLEDIAFKSASSS